MSSTSFLDQEREGGERQADNARGKAHEERTKVGLMVGQKEKKSKRLKKLLERVFLGKREVPCVRPALRRFPLD